MRGIYFEDKNLMFDAWQQLEKKVLFLHEIGTEFYTSIEGNYIPIEFGNKYDYVVLEWIEENDYELVKMPQNEIYEQ
jgi:hypothetical protein